MVCLHLTVQVWHCVISQWTSYQISKIAGCACAGNAGKVFFDTDGGENVPGISGCRESFPHHRCRGKRSRHSRTMGNLHNFRICLEAHDVEIFPASFKRCTCLVFVLEPIREPPAANLDLIYIYVICELSWRNPFALWVNLAMTNFWHLADRWLPLHINGKLHVQRSTGRPQPLSHRGRHQTDVYPGVRI